MRCKACNRMLSSKDIVIDDELCQYCLNSIRSDLNPERLRKFEDLNNLEEGSNGEE